jgi:hypothetical protein
VLRQRCRFVADVEVEPAIAVVVGPSGGLRRIRRIRQAGGGGDVEEAPALAGEVVAQQRVAHHAAVVHPAAAQDEQIRPAVVVEVGVHQVETAELHVEAPLPADVGEGAVAVVAEGFGVVAGVRGRGDHVEPPVVVEIVDDRAAGEIEGRQSRRQGALAPERKGCLGLEGGRRSAQLRRHAGRKLAGEHARQVQQPTRLHVRGIGADDLLVDRRRASRRAGNDVHPAGAHRIEAAVAAVVEDAVALLGAPELGERELAQQPEADLRRQLRGEPQRFLEPLDGAGRPVQTELLEPELRERRDARRAGAAGLRELGRQARERPLAEEGIVASTQAAADLLELGTHLLGRGRHQIARAAGRRCGSRTWRLRERTRDAQESESDDGSAHGTAILAPQAH